ncbi:MAG: VCBS repeat-containing protein [Myxococcales bacterium]|nr:VCBS repeat-containing protein [Myxococcales bacterium]
MRPIRSMLEWSARSWPSLAMMALLVFGTRIANADWPMARHDAARTGAANGVSNITSPAPYWRQFLGGRVGSQQLLTAFEPGPLDGNGDATDDVVVAYVVAAGRLVKFDASGDVSWRSANLELTNVIAIADFDGNGDVQVAVASSAQVYLLRPGNGTVLWAEPFGEMGTIGAVRAADFNGDGSTELWIQECYCCGLNSGNTGYIYDFASGLTNAAIMAELPHAYCGGGTSLVVDDFDGNGLLEGNLADFDTWSMFAPSDAAAPMAATAPLSAWLGLAQCEPVPPDQQSSGAPRDLLCAHSSQLATAGHGHRVFRLAYVAATNDDPARLDVVWFFDAGVIDGGMTLAPNSLLDLDGDGAREVVISGTLAGGQFVTYVLDADTGAVLAAIPDAVVTALVPMRLEGQPPVAAGEVPFALIATQAGKDAGFWRFSRGGAEPVTSWLKLANRRIAMSQDWLLRARQTTAARPLTFDITGDDLPELWMTDAAATTLFVYDVADVPVTAPVVRASRSFGAAQLGAIGALHVRSPGSAPTAPAAAPARLIVTTSDGYVHGLLTANLASRWRAPAGSYYDHGGWNHMPMAPVVGLLGAASPDAIVVSDSRGVLVASSASEALMVRPPALLWEVPDAKSPAVIANSGGSGVMCRRLDRSVTPNAEQVMRLDATGNTIWSSTLGGGINVFGDVVPAQLNTDGVADALVQWGLRSDLVVRMTALDGASGAIMWQYETLGRENRNPAGFAAADVTGDGRDDAIIHHYGTRVIDGGTGVEVMVGGPLIMAYFMPMWTTLGGGSTPSVVLQGGLHPLRTLDETLATRWTSSEDDLPFPYAAVAQCPGVDGLSGSGGAGAIDSVIVAGSVRDGGKLALYRDDGAGSGGASRAPQVQWLAEGQVFSSAQAMTDAGVRAGQLTSAHVHKDLTGTGVPSAVLGSSDGWLYAVNPCNGALQFAYEFDTAVGALAFGDTDGDGLDEIVVSVADGYLYGLKHAPIGSPALVEDLAPQLAPFGVDVDYLETAGDLAASWSAVPGAIRYQVALADHNGEFISAPAGSPAPNVDGWLNVAGTNVTLTDLPLQNGGNYRFAVRAIAADGRASPDAVSDGVTINTDVDVPPPIAPPPPPGELATGGCCQAGNDDRSAAAIAGALAMLGLWRRAWRRRARAQ